MKIKLKPWDEVVKLEEKRTRRVFKNGIDSVFGLYEDDLPWGNYVVSTPADSDGDYFVDETAWVHDWMVDKDEPTSDDILRYGKAVTDDQIYKTFPVLSYTRIRLITYGGELWYHKMIDGEVVDFRHVGTADA